MSHASVVIIGRPNVGKSTLINRILKKRKSITDDQPGVTRDILEYHVKWKKHSFTLVDTGGVFFEKSTDIAFQTDIEALVDGLLAEASRIVLLTDGRQGIHPMDSSIAHRLRPYRAKTIIAVNKVDDPAQSASTSEFFQLGFGTPIAVSATQGSGIDNLIEECVKHFQPSNSSIPEAISLSIVGRPNVGKSSLTNALLNRDRVIVSETSGTTRDSVEINFSYKKQSFLLIDTAGLRKKSKMADSIEFYSSVRTNHAIESADVCIVVLDATDLLRDQDKRVIEAALSAGRRIILFVNKWDLIDDELTKSDVQNRIIREIPRLEHYPIIVGSASERDQITKILDIVPKIVIDGQTRISTPQLNQFITDTIRRNPPPSRNSRPVKVFYGTQVGTVPPEFVLFVNHPRLIKNDYERYLENQLRLRFPCFFGNPLVIKYKSRGLTDGPTE
ncbi:ribosome biogenesis GTPase Der [bacterium]|nr:ribosome biogenesis GTPase Der [bacterium]